MEFEPPASRPYWNVQLFDQFYNALDFMFHQSSFNCHSPRVEEDGKIRLIVSEQAPGVPNRLDKGDYESNVLRFRWRQSAVPTMISIVAPFSRLREHPPSSTPMATP